MTEKRKNQRASRRFALSIVATLAMVVASIVLCWFVFWSTGRTFFQATADHTMDTVEVMRDLGAESVDTHLRSVKIDAKGLAWTFAGELAADPAPAVIAQALTTLKPSEEAKDLWFVTAEGELIGVQGPAAWGDVFPGESASDALASSEATVVTPGYNAYGSYVMAVTAPVLVDGRAAGALVERYDGYLVSEWIADLAFEAGTGSAYLVEKGGRNIAASRAENYDWFETEYNSLVAAAEMGGGQDVSVAELEGRALGGETGVGTYEWDGQTSYLAYGPLKEADWGFYVGFYGASLEAYAEGIVSKSSAPAQVAIALLVLVLGAVALVSVRSLSKERVANDELVRRKREIERQAEALEASEARFKVALEKTGNIVFDYDMASGSIQCFITPESATCCEATPDNLRESLVSGGCVEEESLGLFCDALDDIRHGAYRAECMMEVLDESGEKLWYRASLSSLLADGEHPKRAIGVLEDVTKEREAEYDSLTGLLDRKAAVEMVDAYLSRVDERQRFAFVMLDVDRFKEVNDTFGHLKGDEVLCTLADALSEAFEPPAIVARYGGDEFCLLLPEVEPNEELRSRLEWVNDRMNSRCDGVLDSMALSCSFGVTVRQGPGRTFDELLQEADKALYVAKRERRGTCSFFEA